MNRKFIFSLSFGILALVAGIAWVVTVYAQESQPQSQTGTVVSDDEVNAIAKGLYCPVCPNTPLDVCETKACSDWRAQIKDELSQGWTEDQIVAYFVEQYGERVLGEPRRKGFTSMVWVLPVIAVILGIVIAGMVIKNWRTGQLVSNAGSIEAPKSEIPQISDELRKRIEQEIQQMD